VFYYFILFILLYLLYCTALLNIGWVAP